MTDGPTITIDGRDYTVVTRLASTADGEPVCLADDEDGRIVTLIRARYGRWRLWTAPNRAAAAKAEEGGER